MRKFSRGKPYREACKIVLLICEGDSEAVYFNNFNKREWNFIRIRTINTDKTDPINLIISAKRQKQKMNPESTWCIFDIESKNQEMIDKVVKSAGQNIRIISSNPCYELWLLLHFQIVWANLNVEDTIRILKNHIPTYCKGKNFFEDTEPITKTAIDNSKRLEKHHIGLPEYSINRNPSTKIYDVVEHIFDLINRR